MSAMNNKNIAEAFKSINKIGSAERGTVRGTKERAMMLLAEVASGISKVTVKDKKTQEKKEVERRLGPAQMADRVIRALRFGATVEEVKTACPKLGESFPWENAREAIFMLAKERKVDLTDAARAFGLEAEDTKVVASEEEEEEDAGKKGKNAKASNAANKRSGRGAHA